MRKPPARYALTLIRRELRADLRRFGFFLACLVLGVGAIAGVGSLAAAIEAGVRADAGTLLGGDVEIMLANRPLTPAEERFLGTSGKISEILTLQAMARTSEHEAPVALKAVDSAYPLYGRLALEPQGSLAAALSRRRGHFGAVVDQGLLERLHLRLGEAIRIGKESLIVRARIAHEPDLTLGGLVFGPRVILSRAALEASGILVPGTLATYRYRLLLPPGKSAPAWVKAARAAFPEAGWRLRTAGEALPRLRRLTRNVALFLRLIAFFTLLVGGIGIAGAVESHLAQKRETIATLKCLGAPGGLLFLTYFGEVLTLAFLGIVLGLLLGAAVPLAAKPALSPLLPLPLKPGLYPAPLLYALAAGLLTALAFSIFPLAASRNVPPAALFRAAAASPRPLAPIAASAVGMLAAAALFALAVAGAGDRRAGLYFAAGALLAFGSFAAAGRLIGAAARRFGRPRSAVLRLALQNLARPGAPAPRILLSLGLSLSLFIAIGLIEKNLSQEIEARLPTDAPAFFFIDIEPAERAGFAAIVDGLAGARFEEVPMLRGRITKVGGVPVEKAKIAPSARWAVDSDRGLTYAATLPKGSVLTAGKWWPPDYRGPPLVSMDEEIARGMGLGVGDRITVNLLGREITARIASLRRVDWGRLGINFVLLFSPGTLEGAPQTDLAAVTLPPSEEGALLSRVTRRFPNIAAIPVRDALAAVADILRKIGAAVRTAALLALLSGTLVLGGAVAAGHRERTRDAVLLKVLGATRADIARTFLIENAIIGALCAVLAGGAGTLIARVVVARMFRTDWEFFLAPVFGTALFAILLSLSLGFAATLRALGKRPAAYLRGE